MCVWVRPSQLKISNEATMGHKLDQLNLQHNTKNSAARLVPVQKDGALPRGRAYKSLLRSCILNTTITFILTACKSLTTSTATPVYSHMLIKGINCNSLLLMEVRAVKS